MFFKIDRQKDNPLFMSYEYGDIHEFRSLIESGYNVNCIHNNGGSLIAEVIINTHGIKNNKKFFDELIKSGVYLYSIGTEANLLNLAIIHQEDSYYIKQLLKSGIDINLKNTNNKESGIIDQPSLFVAADWNRNISKYNFEKLDILLKHNPDISIENTEGSTLINHAVSNGSKMFFEMFPILLKNKINLNQSDSDGGTALHLLSTFNSYEGSWVIDAMKLLLDNNADPNVREKSGVTPLIISCHHNHIHAAEILIKNSADMNIMDNNGMTAAMHAANRGNFEILRLLYYNKANFTIVNNDGDNIAKILAMKIDVKSKNTEIYNFLYQHADLLSVKNKNGICAFDIIEKKDKLEYIKLVRIKRLIEKDKKTNPIENTIS